MLVASVAPWVWLHLLVVAGYTVSVCFIWPAVEALITHDEPASRVPHTVGVYNCTWSIASASAYFTGGAIYDWLGARALFLLPGAVFAIEWWASGRLERRAAALEALSTDPPLESVAPSGAASVHAAGAAANVPSSRVDRESVFLRGHLHAARDHAQPGEPVCLDAGGNGPARIGLALRAHVRVLRVVALDRVALPISLARRRLRAHDRELHGRAARTLGVDGRCSPRSCSV